MARKAGLLLNIIIFALLWVFGALFFGSGFGGAMGTTTSMLYIGESLLGTSSLASEGGGSADLLFAFIVTAAVYYLVSLILAFILTRLFGRREE